MAYIVRTVDVTSKNANKIQLARLLSGNYNSIDWLDYCKTETILVISLYPVDSSHARSRSDLVFGYINCGRILLVFCYCLHIVLTFPSSSNIIALLSHHPELFYPSSPGGRCALQQPAYHPLPEEWKTLPDGHNICNGVHPKTYQSLLLSGT